MSNKKNARFFTGGSHATTKEVRPRMLGVQYCTIWYGTVRPEICKVDAKQAAIFDELIPVIRDRCPNERINVPVHATVAGMIGALYNLLIEKMEMMKDVVTDAVLDRIESVKQFFEKLDQRPLKFV